MHLSVSRNTLKNKTLDLLKLSNFQVTLRQFCFIMLCKPAREEPGSKFVVRSHRWHYIVSYEYRKNMHEDCKLLYSLVLKEEITTYCMCCAFCQVCFKIKFLDVSIWHTQVFLPYPSWPIHPKIWHTFQLKKHHEIKYFSSTYMQRKTDYHFSIVYI